jgi:hypothetical protein
MCIMMTNKKYKMMDRIIKVKKKTTIIRTKMTRLPLRRVTRKTHSTRQRTKKTSL